MVNPICSKCGGKTLIGFLQDISQNATIQCQWIEGHPEPYRFLGMNTGALTVRDRRRLAVNTYRCEECGYLESYAPNPDAPENTLLRPAQGDGEADSDILVRPHEQTVDEGKAEG